MNSRILIGRFQCGPTWDFIAEKAGKVTLGEEAERMCDCGFPDAEHDDGRCPVRRNEDDPRRELAERKAQR